MFYKQLYFFSRLRSYVPLTAQRLRSGFDDDHDDDLDFEPGGRKSDHFRQSFGNRRDRYSDDDFNDGFHDRRKSDRGGFRRFRDDGVKFGREQNFGRDQRFRRDRDFGGGGGYGRDRDFGRGRGFGGGFRNDRFDRPQFGAGRGFRRDREFDIETPIFSGEDVEVQMDFYDEHADVTNRPLVMYLIFVLKGHWLCGQHL